MIEEIIAQVERVLRIGLTIITAYLVALWIASIWWTFRDIRSRTSDLFLQVAASDESTIAAGAWTAWPQYGHAFQRSIIGCSQRAQTRFRRVWHQGQ